MYSKAVLSSFLYLPVKEIENIQSLREELTVVPKYDGTPIEMFDEKVDWFGVPLYHYHVPPADNIGDQRVESPIEIEFRGELRPGQKELYIKFSYLRLVNKNTGFIIEAPPGWGKTAFAIYLIAKIKQRTLVVVPRSNLIRQWVERLLKFSNLKRSEIGWVEGGKGDWKNKKVVVGLVHSLVLNRFGHAFTRSFGTVFFDEVDRSVPPQTFAPAVAMFPAKYRIGLSAVLKRQDGMEVIFQKHIGQVYLKGGEEGRMKPKVLIHYYSPTSGFVYPGSQKLNRRGMILSRLAGNPMRNQIVAQFVSLIWKSNRKCLVLSDRKAQLDRIHEILRSKFAIPFTDIGFYIRSFTNGRPMTDRERRKTASDCKIILGTYGMISLGTDIPDLAGLVYATPQSEIKQSQGRIERALEGKKQPVVVDIIDTAYTDCLRWGQKRMRQYRSQGLGVKNVT